MALSKGENRGSTGIVNIFDDNADMSYDLGINEDAIAHIINRLTDLYRNPVEATVRETVSNALDATNVYVEEGHEFKPVEISTPGHVSPYFIVQDYGVGMSMEVIRKIYTQYGGTTKSGSYNQIGSYGLGAKAPLSYAAEYEITTTNEGVTTKFVIFRNETGPRVNIIESVYTGDVSGTTVKVPVDYVDFTAFDNAASTYKDFSFNQPIIINSIEYFGNDRYTLVGEMIIEEEAGVCGRVWFNKDHTNNVLNKLVKNSGFYSQNLHYVLNGYVYDSPNNNKLDYSKDIVIELKPGVVDFSSSRDEITSNERLVIFENLIKKQLSNDSSLLYDAYLKHIQSLPFRDATMFMVNSSIKPVFNLVDNGNDVSIDTEHITFSNCDNKWDVAELTSAEGINLVTDFFGVSHPSVFAYAYDNDNNRHRFYGVARTEENNVFPSIRTISGLSITDQRNAVFSAAKDSSEGGMFSIANAIFSEISTSYRASLNPLIFVSVADENEVRKVLNKRKVMFNIFPHYTIIFVDSEHTISDEEKNIIEMFYTENQVKYFTIESLFEELKKFKSSSSVNKSVNYYVQSLTGYPDRKSLIMPNFVMRGFKSGDIDDLVEEYENAIYVPYNYSHMSYSSLQSALNGYMEEHGETALNGRPIIILERPTKPIFDTIDNFDNVIFHPSFTHTSIAVKKAMEAQTYDRPVNDDKVNYVDVDSLVGAYIRARFGTYKQPFIDAIYTLDRRGLATSDMVNAAEFYETAIENNGHIVLSTEALRERISEETFDKIVTLFAVQDWHKQVYYGYGALSHAFNLAISDNELPRDLREASAAYILTEFENNLSKKQNTIDF